jgi:hypothetical protein
MESPTAVAALSIARRGLSLVIFVSLMLRILDRWADAKARETTHGRLVLQSEDLFFPVGRERRESKGKPSPRPSATQCALFSKLALPAVRLIQRRKRPLGWS